MVSYLDFGDTVCGQLNVGEVALAERNGVHRVSPDTLDLLAHRVGFGARPQLAEAVDGLSFRQPRTAAAAPGGRRRDGGPVDSGGGRRVSGRGGGRRRVGTSATATRCRRRRTRLPEGEAVDRLR